MGIFEESHPNKKNKKNNNMSTDMGSVADPEICAFRIEMYNCSLKSVVAGRHYIGCGW